MARTIAEIQQEILNQKEEVDQLSALEILTTNEKQTLEGKLTSTSKTAIWRLWVYIVATAIWMHEKIVERNALLSRPHTLSWYREQALNYIQGAPLVWKDGYYQFDTSEIIGSVEEKKIIAHCAISERLFNDLFNENGTVIDDETQNTEALIKEFYYNQVGIVTMKVAKRVDGKPVHLDSEDGVNGEKRAFIEYMNLIKDAGTQIRVISIAGDNIKIVIDVYVDPLIIYTEGQNAGRMIRDLSRQPVEEAIKTYIETLEFNGAFVPTFLVDKVQQVPGVQLPILRKVLISNHSVVIDEVNNAVYNDSDNTPETAFFVPTAGYFDTDFDDDKNAGLEINYIAYNLQTDPSFNL